MTSTKIAAFIYAESVMEQYDDEGWEVYGDDIEERFTESFDDDWKDNENFIEEIKEELFKFPGMNDDTVSVEMEDDLVFKINLPKKYRAC